MRRRRQTAEEHTKPRALAGLLCRLHHAALRVFCGAVRVGLSRQQKHRAALECDSQRIPNMGAFPAMPTPRMCMSSPRKRWARCKPIGRSSWRGSARQPRRRPRLQQLRSELQAAMGDELKNHERTCGDAGRIRREPARAGFFDSGQAALLPGAVDKITRIARILSNMAGAAREGHSDNQPIITRSFAITGSCSTARA